VDQAAMKRFWDARAREDPFYFVDNQLRYREPDLERFWAGGQEALDKMMELLDVRIVSTDTIVEIGCGVGRITRSLAERGRRVIALDVSEQMLDAAKRLNPGLDNVEWILGNGERLAPIGAASADVCHSFVVFQHVPDPRVTLGYVREMGRVLRPGGIAFFQVSNRPDVHEKPPLRKRLVPLLGAVLGRAPKGQLDPAWRGSAIDLNELRSVARGASLDVERVVGEGTQFCLVLLRKGDLE
jgi:SAM-dependent methyltransferase